MKIYELMAIYDSRQNFYHKAVVREIGNKSILYSYETRVATIDRNKHTCTLNKKIEKSLLFSQTTLRHIKEFIAQELGVYDLTKKDIIEWCY